jgi:hypothetical protein
LENKDPLSPTGEEPGSYSAENQDPFQGPENPDLFFQKGRDPPKPFSCRVENQNLSQRVGVRGEEPRFVSP